MDVGIFYGCYPHDVSSPKKKDEKNTKIKSKLNKYKIHMKCKVLWLMLFTMFMNKCTMIMIFFEMYDKQVKAEYFKEYTLLIATSSDTHKSCLFYIKTENKI